VSWVIRNIKDGDYTAGAVFEERIKMRKIEIKSLYISALTLVLFIMVLLAFVAFSTYHTLSSNKENAISAIDNQGNAILDVILISLKEIFDERGFLPTEKAPHSEIVSLIDDLIRGIRAKRIIGHFCIFSEAGDVNYHSKPDFKIDINNLHWVMNSKKEKVSNFRKLKNGTSVYEITRRIPSFFNNTKKSTPSLNAPFEYIVLGIEMTEFEAARKADINHSVIMVLILMILAGSALFFIYIIRSYYHVNHELIESRDYIHSVVDNMANGLISINHVGAIIACNRPAEILLGIEKQGSSRTVTLDAFIDFEDTGILTTLTDGLMVQNKEIQYKNPDGRIRTILLNATPLTESDNNIRGAVIILNDLSEIKILEDKVKRAEQFSVIGKIASVVAHEIRNPLSSIRGFATFFCKTLPEGEKNYEYANIIVDEVDRINRVITDLLQYSRSETLVVKNTDLRALVEQTLLLIELDLSGRDSVVVNSIPDDFYKVQIDSDKMKQVLLNLLLNAIQVSEGKLLIEIGADIADDNSVHLWVEDNGPGINVKEKKLIFDPFFSLRDQGSGLGLSIVQKIVEAHGGQITFNSPVTPDSMGTRFTITLPFT